MPVDDLEYIVDRVSEQELFRRLLTFEDDARLLAIHDAAGRGKSTLLRRLRYNCTWERSSQIANSLIPWNEHQSRDFFDLVKAIHDDLKQLKLDFPKFHLLRTHLALKDFTAFKGHADFRTSTISGGKQAGIIDYVAPLQPPQPWNEEMEAEARNQCVSTFLKELMNAANEQPIVIMFDAWESCAASLKREILNRIIQPFCFDMNTRPKWFILVIAGREPFSFKQLLGDTLFSQLVHSVESLSKWEREHVKDFLSVNGYKDMSDEDIDIIFNRISRGLSLDAAITLAKFLGETPSPPGYSDPRKE